jgi:hypothetical protein
MITFWILMGAIVAIVTGLIVNPLRKENPKLALFLIAIIPFLSMGLYFLWGASDLVK